MSALLGSLHQACLLLALARCPGAALLRVAHGGSLPTFAAATQPQMVCDDYPVGWRDRAGRTCEEYEGDKLCTSSQSYGPGWQQAWGAFRNYGNLGQTGLGACCACGGGSHNWPSTCSYMQCPAGFRTKENGWRLYCKDLECSVDADLWACCEAHPDVRQAVGEVRSLTAALKDKVRQEVREAGATEAKLLGERAAERAAALGREFVSETEGLQAAALDYARKDFASRTQHSDTVRQVSEYQIKLSGHIAGRDSEEGRVDEERLREEVTNAAHEFGQARQAWKQTDDVSHRVVSKGQIEWEAYYEALNRTWPVIVEGINSVNGAVAEATVPGQAVRWSEQAVRLAADSAQVTQGQMGGIDVHVAQAEDRAAEALRATQTNGDRISALEEMVATATGGGR